MKIDNTLVVEMDEKKKFEEVFKKIRIYMT